MAKFKVLIYSAAKQDLMDIVEYMNTISPEAALRQYDHIIEKISSLSDMPERCPMCRDTLLQLKGYRVLVVDNYLVFFVVKNDLVQIRRIIYGKRKYEWMF
jgi:plasmid stabilization system protein ParE